MPASFAPVAEPTEDASKIVGTIDVPVNDSGEKIVGTIDVPVNDAGERIVGSVDVPVDYTPEENLQSQLPRLLAGQPGPPSNGSPQEFNLNLPKPPPLEPPEFTALRKLALNPKMPGSRDALEFLHSRDALREPVAPKFGPDRPIQPGPTGVAALTPPADFAAQPAPVPTLKGNVAAVGRVPDQDRTGRSDAGDGGRRHGGRRPDRATRLTGESASGPGDDRG